ncbi:RNA polymerase sigma factor [Pseudomonas sp. NPDC089752]|uniref:RNA polymerase sigma factor n=1 Tax=Pseudomonas sp. NPDC089752 TaxID=3364472 RepID=UPI003806406F
MPNEGDCLPNLLPTLLPQLRAFAMRLSGDHHDAEDLLQFACMRALERAHQLQPGTCALSWAFAIVHSSWINEMRSRRVRSRSRSEWDENVIESVCDPCAPTPETELMHQQILTALNNLPEGQRDVMLLVAVERFSYREAAQILEIPIGTVMSRMSRARQAIGAMLDERRQRPRLLRA